MFFDFVLRVGLAVLLTVGTFLLTRLLLARFAMPLLRRTRPAWASTVEQSRLPNLVAWLAAVLMLGVAAGLLAVGYPEVAHVVVLLDTAAGIAILTFILTTMASIGLTIYQRQPLANDVPLAGFVQLMQGVIILIGALMVVAVFLGVPAIYSFAALAAIFTALGFVFQDPIMGFVAGIQLAANKMVAIGDWIEVSAFGANGTVKEILMSTVKVQNWDNTITTVPTRALISDSFKNWRPMYAAGGRRMQRSINLDVHTVRTVTPELLERFTTLARVWQQIGAGDLVADDILVGEAAAQPTNLGVYRVYLTDYLQHHPHVNQEMVRMVRQLQVEDCGLPLEIYVFLLDTSNPTFETTMSSILEHVFATLPEFGLRPFQRPQSTDINNPGVSSAAQ